MSKEQFFERLKSLKEPNKDPIFEYNVLNDTGINKTLKYFTKEEATFVSKYLRSYPTFYYKHFFYDIFGVDMYEKINNYTNEMKEVMWEYYTKFYTIFVGPFFYIDGKIKGLRMSFTQGSFNDEFIGSMVSHFSYFCHKHFEGDYGNYPRGRVIYNNNTNEFYIYIDKSLKNNKKVIEEIKRKYRLIDNNTVIKTDDHYTHDNL